MALSALKLNKGFFVADNEVLIVGLNAVYYTIPTIEGVKLGPSLEEESLKIYHGGYVRT